MAGGQSILDVATIAAAANARAETFAAEFLPNGWRSGDRRYWETNNLDDNPRADSKRSLKVNLTGPYRGQWRDFATGEHGDIIDLCAIRQFGGGDDGKKAAIQWLKSKCGLDGLDPSRIARVQYQAVRAAEAAAQAADEGAALRTRNARGLFLSGRPIAGTAAEAYLMRRGIEAGESGWPGSLVYHDEVWNGDARVKLPCMIATMVRPDGVQIAAHRTWLARDRRGHWGKADGGDVGVPRGAAKKVIGRSGGAFVPIAKGASGQSMGKLTRPDTVYVTEGIEDALTVRMAKPAARVIAAYSLGNIGMIEFPPLIETVVIVADRDQGKALDLLERAIARQQAQGKRVQLVLPPPAFKDVNAWLTGDAAAEAVAA